MFDIGEWNVRWRRDGQRGGVSPYQMDDEKYIERNQRDRERLEMAFGWTGQERFESGIEVGCGAGRLTPVMLSVCKNLTCVDGSLTASEYFKKAFPHIPHYVSLIKNLPFLSSIREGTFDLAMTFTVVQHINDYDEWEASVKAIQAILKPNGFYVMHEDISAHIQNRKAASHMNERSLEDYRKALNKCELVNHEILYFSPTNEHDLIATWRKQ